MQASVMAPEEVAGGVWGWFVAGLAAIGVGAFKARAWLSRDRVTRTGDAASAEVIDMLRRQLRENQEYTTNVIRGLVAQRDEWIVERAELTRALAELKAEVMQLQAQIRRMEGEL